MSSAESPSKAALTSDPMNEMPPVTSTFLAIHWIPLTMCFVMSLRNL